MSLWYDIKKTYEENLLEGPFFDGAIPERVMPPKKDWINLFDYQVMMPLGVPACPFVVNARGLKLASDLGFDVITWKTIRSKATLARPYPNVALLRNTPIHSFSQLMTVTETLPDSFADLAVTVSIGNASHEFDWVMSEMERGVSYIKPGQILISSIYGVGDTQDALIADFVHLACRVKEVGVHAVEANISCPNVDGLLYKDVELVSKLCSALVSVLGATPLTIKLGIFDSKDEMKKILTAAAAAGVRGITGINAIGLNVVDENGEQYFKGRPHAGVCGAPVQPYGLQFVRDARCISDTEKLDLTILGCGGITLPEHIDLFFDAGADAALSGSGALYNPYIVSEYQSRAAHIFQKKSEPAQHKGM